MGKKNMNYSEKKITIIDKITDLSFAGCMLFLLLILIILNSVMKVFEFGGELLHGKKCKR